MLIMRGKKRNYTCAAIQAKNIRCENNYIRVSDIRHAEFRFPYDELIAAYIEILDKKTKTFYRPELMELTEDMDGLFILYNDQFERFEIHLEQTRKTAGLILKQLAVYAPYLSLGYQPWLDEHDEEQFSDVKEMVSVMKDISDESVKWGS